MLYRRSRTESPRASPFVVLSSMEMTLLTVVYVGPQTALDLPGRVRQLPVCPKSRLPEAFTPPSTPKSQYQPLPGSAPAFLPARYYLERQTAFLQPFCPLMAW